MIFSKHLLPLIGLSAILFFCYACKTQSLTRDLLLSEVQHLEADEKELKNSGCRERSFYAPNPDPEYALPIRKVRVNYHYISNMDSTSNYQGEKAKNFTRDISYQANEDLGRNAKMNLPLGNNTEVLPTGYRYVRIKDKSIPGHNGTYCHYDDDEDICYFVHKGKNRNSPDKTLIHKYGVNKDSVLNVFILPHHPDSVKSRTYNHIQTGIALGNSVKVSGILEVKGYQPWLFRGLINHEIGHVLGLGHTWRGNDGCEDTPNNPNCWQRTKNGSPCDSLNSNNVMDYNMNQNAWTPCQLARIHYNFARIGSRQRKLLIPTWCKLDTTWNMNIRNQVHWRRAMDLNGHIIIHPGASLKIDCRVALPKGAQILVKPGGHLILNNARLHNDCGEEWEGIKIVEQRKGKKVVAGKVSFIGDPQIENVRNAEEGKEKET